MVNDVRFLAGPNGATLYLLHGEERGQRHPLLAWQKAVLKMRELMYAGQDELALQILEMMATEAQARQLNRQSEENSAEKCGKKSGKDPCSANSAMPIVHSSRLAWRRMPPRGQF